MTSPGQLVPSHGQRRDVELVEVDEQDAALLGLTYRAIGAPLHWHGRMAWSDADWRRELGRPGVRAWVALIHQDVSGLVELEIESDAAVGIVVFGLVPDLIGRGFGSTLLTLATRLAWQLETISGTRPRRVWVETSSHDHPHALPNYCARGFRLRSRRYRGTDGGWFDVPVGSSLDDRIVVERSRIHGMGLVAAQRIEIGEVVMRPGGTVLTDVEVRERISHGERYDGLVLDDDLNLSIEPPDWSGIHGNHSCDPNIWLVEPLELAARRAITEGEEVTSDYATYTITPTWRMACACGAPECRGTVSGNDWMNVHLQHRYAGHFAVPIQRRIARASVERVPDEYRARTVGEV